MLYHRYDSLISEEEVVDNEISLVGWVLIGMAAAAGPLRVSANGDPLASSTPQLTPRATAPGNTGLKPEFHRSEGEQGEITPSDIPVFGDNPVSGADLSSWNKQEKPDAVQLPGRWV